MTNFLIGRREGATRVGIVYCVYQLVATSYQLESLELLPVGRSRGRDTFLLDVLMR